jgi:quercetin dioxygenase-like cupin family protein
LFQSAGHGDADQEMREMKLTNRLVVQTEAESSDRVLAGPVADPEYPGVRRLSLHTLPRPFVRFSVVEFEGGSDAPVHYSATANYWIVVDGTVESIVPGQEPVTLREGDCCVQVDVHHGWRVSPNETAVLLAVVVDTQADPK